MCSKKIFGLILLLTFHISSSRLISIPTSSILLISITTPKSILQYTEAVPTSSTDRKRRRQEEREKRRQQRDEQRRQFNEQYFGDDYNTNDEGEGSPSFDMSSLPSLFNTQKPRDILEGLKMSLSNTLRGTFYGLTAFIATPIGGLKYGIVGFIGGILTGSILGITMPLYGVIVGIYQFARGIIETPKAVMDGFVNCKVYDDTKREWLEYRLDDDIDEINRLIKEEQLKGSSSGSGSRGGTTSSSSSRRRVKSTEYYDLLDVQPDASPSEIRSAYRKKARIIHPDKNPDDPNAEENFRILSAAYQTLSDPNKRHKYDTSGRGVDPESPDGSGDGSIMIDPIVFFAILFGSEQVEPYIGELSLATTFDALLKLGNSGGRTSSFESWEDVKTAFGWNEAALKRRKRETEIAIHLRNRIADYVDGYLTFDAFKDGCWEEAVQIAKGSGSSSYGASFLLAIGPALIVEADAFLGYRSSVLGSWRGPISNVKRNLLFIRRKFAVGRSVLRTISHSLRALYESAEVTPNNNDGSRDSMNQQRHSSGHDRSRSSSDKNNNKRRSDSNRVDIDQELLKDNLSNTIPTILDMAWAINYVDISNTLYGACGKLFYDADISSWDERLRRAEAVHILGSQFYIVGLEISGGNKTIMTAKNVDDIKAQANAAFMESLKKKRRDEM